MPQRRKPHGVGGRRSSARVLLPGTAMKGGKGEERSPARGYAVSEQPGGNCVAMVSVRSVVAV